MEGEESSHHLLRDPLHTPPTRLQAQHLPHIVWRLHHLPPWINPRWAFRDSLLVHPPSPWLAKEVAISVAPRGKIFHGARQEGLAMTQQILQRAVQAVSHRRRRMPVEPFAVPDICGRDHRLEKAMESVVHAPSSSWV